jgi:hypothetical protein
MKLIFSLCPLSFCILRPKCRAFLWEIPLGANRLLPFSSIEINTWVCQFNARIKLSTSDLFWLYFRLRRVSRERERTPIRYTKKRERKKAKKRERYSETYRLAVNPAARVDFSIWKFLRRRCKKHLQPLLPSCCCLPSRIFSANPPRFRLGNSQNVPPEGNTQLWENVL